MNDAILAGVKKLSTLINGKVEAYVDEDGSYYIIGITESDCRTNAKIVTQVLDEIYKHTDNIDVTILLMEKNAYNSYIEKHKNSLRKIYEQ